MGSSQSSAGSYFREATATAAALTLSRCGSNCSHAREYSNPHSREYSSGAPPPSSLPPHRGGAQDYSASCDVRRYSGGGARDVRDFVTARREVRDHSGRRLPSSAMLHQAVRTSGCPNLVRPTPLSPYLPHHSGIPFPPAIMSAHHMCSDPFSCALHAAGSQMFHPPGHALRLYAPVGPESRLVYDSDGDKWGSLRSLSVTAVRGSSSSDPNPSDTSLECDCCRGGSGGGGGHVSNSDSNFIDSNRSTYGSSEPKDSSDVSSYDSRVYQAKGSGSSADERDRRRGRSSSSPPAPRSVVAAAVRASCPVPHKTRALHRPVMVEEPREEVKTQDPDSIVVVHEPEEGRVVQEVEGEDEDDDEDEEEEDGVCDVCSAQESSGDTGCPACGRDAGSPLSVLENLGAVDGVEVEEADFDGGATDDRCLVTKRSREEGSDASGVVTQGVTPDHQDDVHATAKPSETVSDHREHLRPLLPSAAPSNARGANPGDSGLGHRRVRSASCRRHTSAAVAVHRSHSASQPRHHHSNNTVHAYSNPRNISQASGSRTRAGTALSVSSSRHHRSHGNASSSSHHHSHRQSASASGSPSRRPSSSSSSRRYLWALEHRAGLNPGPIRTRSYHHQYLGQCDICARQQALYLAAAQLHNSVGNGGGGGGAGGGVPHVVCDPLQGVLCRLCHQRGRVSDSAGPKHSMVLFTEPQGKTCAMVCDTGDEVG